MSKTIMITGDGDGNITRQETETPIKKEVTAADMWGFGFNRGISQFLAPNGMARYNNKSAMRVARIPYLSEEMIANAVDAACNQHNLYLKLLYEAIEEQKQTTKKAAEGFQDSYNKCWFWQYKRKEFLADCIMQADGSFKALEQCQRLMGTIKPTNVKEREEGDV